MKNLHNNATMQQVVKASITTNFKEGFCLNNSIDSILKRGIIFLIILLILGMKNFSFGQVIIVDRPQAMDKTTGFMQLDGLFDVNLGEQKICVYLKNTGPTAIQNVNAIASFSPSSGIVLTDNFETYGTLNPGATVMGFFTANFSGSYPDKHLMTLMLQGTGFNQVVSRKLFVLRSENIDSTSWKSYVPEGFIKTQMIDNYYNGNAGGLALPKDYVWTVEYNTPYQGQFGPIPFNDPWWKVLGACVGVAGGLTYIVGGVVKYCGDEKTGELLKDIGTGAGGGGAIVAAADSIDVFRRGQQHTFPSPTGEMTWKEEVDMHVTYNSNAALGVNYNAMVTWNYRRYTNLNMYTYSVTETASNNIHFTTSRNLTINNSTFSQGSNIVITAHVTGFQTLQNDKAHFVANIFPDNQNKISTLARTVVMRDDGHFGDPAANDGIYTGMTSANGLPTNRPLGVYITGFDVNNAADGINPLIAAMEIGGIMISTPPTGGCAVYSDYIINVISAVTLVASATDASCSGASNGTASVTPSGGTPPYTVSWSSGQTGTTISGIASGVYYATVTDANGIMGVTYVTVNQSTGLKIDAIVTQPYCSGNGLGAIQVSVAGNPSVSYSWNDGSNLSNRTNLLPGLYTVIAFDANGCQGTQTYNLSATTQTPVINCPSDITTTTEPGKNYATVNFNVTTVQGCPEFITVTATPASGSAFNKGITVVNCKATDGNGMTSTCTFNVTVNDNEAPIADISNATVALNTNGTVTLTPLMLNDSSTDNCGIFSKLIAPNPLTCANIGTNTVTMTVSDGNNNYWTIDSNGVKYYNNNNVLISTHTTLGKVSVIVTKDGGFIVIDDGRVRKFDKNGNLQSTIFTTGAVQVILTSDGGFIVIDDGRVRKYDSNGNLQSTIFTTGQVTVISMGDCGFIVIDDGRVRKYDKDGNLQSTIFTSGKVTVIQTSDCGFIVIDDGRVRKYDGNGNLQSTIFTTGDVKVITTSDGGFIVIDDGRVRKYDKDGNLQSTIFTNGQVTVINMGDCGFIVIDDGRVRKYDKDGNLQSTIFTTGKVTVIQTSDCGFIVIDDGRVRKYDGNGNLQSTIFTNGEVKVITTSDGGFIVIDDGRVRKYDSNGNLQSTIFTTGKVTVINMGDCGFIVIDDGRVRKYDKDGNLQSTIFTNGKVTVIQTSDCGFIVIDEGRVRKYDGNGNLQSTIFTAGEVTVIPTSDGGFIVIDDGRVRKYDKDGNLQSTIFTTGTTKVITDANGGFKVMDDGRIRVYDKDGNLMNTIFTISSSYIYTNNSLTDTASAFVTVPNPLAISGTVVNVNCSGKKTGKITITVSGLTGTNTYLWSNGKTVKNLSTLAAGTYTVTVTNSHGCSNSSTFVVTQPGALIVNVAKTTIKCGGASTGTATATPGGGTPPYLYSWNTAPMQTNAIATGLSAGVYAVTITDAGGCTKTKSVTITQNTPLSVAIQQSFDHATAVPSGGVPPYTYKWNTNPQQTNATATGLTCGNTYTVTVKDSKGCSSVVSFVLACPRLGESSDDNQDVVSVYPNPTAGHISIDILNTDNEVFNIEVLDAVGKVVYAEDQIQSDSNNKMTLDLSTLANGIYSLKIIAGNEIKMAKVVIEK